jgi:chromosome segregation ATPase
MSGRRSERNKSKSVPMPKDERLDLLRKITQLETEVKSVKAELLDVKEELKESNQALDALYERTENLDGIRTDHEIKIVRLEEELRASELEHVRIQESLDRLVRAAEGLRQFAVCEPGEGAP